MLDKYSYLTNEEFLQLFKDRIPEDLLPRIESVLSEPEGVWYSEEEYNDLQHKYDSLWNENNGLEDDIYYLEKRVTELERENEMLQGSLDEYIDKLK